MPSDEDPKREPSDHTPPDEPIGESDLGFTYRRRKSGEIELLHHGRHAVTLRGAAASDFLAEVESCPPPDTQQLMARLTGNFKRGNERVASSHPRNRRR